MKKTITFIARNYPPSLNINGESVCDMIGFLQENYPEIVCNVVYIDKTTGQGGKKREPLGNLVKIKNRFDGKSGPMKLIKLLYDGYILVKTARKLKSDLFVITTSPPLLPFWAARGLGRKNKRALWALDLFPEMFKANGNIRESNFIYRWILKKTYSDKPEFVIALGPQQASYITKSCYRQEIPISILPCGAFEGKPSDTAPDWYDSEKIIIGYCGNVHDAHNPDFICFMIEAIDPDKHLLILALYGDKAPGLIKFAKDKKGVILTPGVPRDQLAFIDIHMVSLLPGFTHYAVPSKAVSAVTMGKPVLFCGNEESDNWYMFRDAGWLIPDNLEMKEQITIFCQTISKAAVDEKAANAMKYAAKLEEMVLNSYHFVGNYVSGLK
ncbi:hypothetical protein [Fluviicola sp.]|uniref:hypothetical protein n=1 Tax=Fluviicola sp. TaxID=1917219 RepID=UPI002623388E|nr:hypothetical protein [Fluviicola sp.]